LNEPEADLVEARDQHTHSEPLEHDLAVLGEGRAEPEVEALTRERDRGERDREQRDEAEPDAAREDRRGALRAAFERERERGKEHPGYGDRDDEQLRHHLVWSRKVRDRGERNERADQESVGRDQERVDHVPGRHPAAEPEEAPEQ
jgi:hypothetical protein